MATPRLYQTRLRVPEFEANAFGELFASSLVRFLQQAAVEASTDAGFDGAWYAREGTVWVVRRSTVEIRDAARAGDDLEITTWVADFRRVRSRREYEVRRTGELEPIAVAHADWVYLERASGKLTRVPEEMIRGFVPEGDAPALPREPLGLGPAPSDAFLTRRPVRFRDLDGMLHVNNAVYLDYVEETFFDALAARDWTLARCLEAGGYLRAARHDVEYLDEARPGDELACLSWDEGGGSASEIRRAGDGAALTRARSRWTWIDAATRRSGEPPAGLFPTPA